MKRKKNFKTNVNLNERIMSFVVLSIFCTCFFVNTYSVAFNDMQRQSNEKMTETAGNSKAQGVSDNGEELLSDKYLVSEEYSYIGRVIPGTSIEDFKSGFNLSSIIKVYTKSDLKTEVTTGLVGTGMVLRCGERNKVYDISVITDLNGDGQGNQIELSKMIKHIVGLKDYKLEGIFLNSADLNGDGISDQRDISAIINYIVFGDLNVPEINRPKPSIITVLEGTKGENDWYKSKVKLQINNGKDQVTDIEKITYKIEGKMPVEETKIEDGKQIELVEDGTYTVISYVYAKNKERSEATSEVVKIDKTLPTVGSMNMKLNDANGEGYVNGVVTNNNVYVEISDNGKDEISTVQTSYEVTGANVVPVGTKNPTILTEEGLSTVIINTKDEAGNISKKEYTVNINKAIIGEGNIEMRIGDNKGKAYTSDTWTNENVFIGIVGNAGLSYEVTGANTVPAGTKTPSTLKNEGISNVIVTIVNSGSEVKTEKYIVKIDRTITKPAAMNMKLNNQNGKDYLNDTWTSGSVYVEMKNGTDAISGILEMSYEVTGANVVPAGTTEPTTLTNDGISNIKVIIKDNAGNYKEQEYIVKIDKLNPEKVNMIVTGDKVIEDGQWYGNDVTVKITEGLDNGSAGIKNITYEITGNKDVSETVIQSGNSIIISEDGIYTITAYEYDNSGNRSEPETVVIKLDKTAPITGTVNMKLKDKDGDMYTNREITNQDVYIELVNGTDNLEVVETSYEVIGANPIGAGQVAPSILTQDGENTVIVTTKDEAGYVVTKEYTININKEIARQGNIEMKLKDSNSDVYWNDTWTNQNVYVGIVGEAKKISYEVTGANIVAAGTKTPSTLTNEGISTIAVTTVNEDDSSKIDTYSVKIDKSNPEKSSFNVTGNKATNGSEWYVSNVQVQINGGTDNGSSGVSKITYEITGDKNIKETVIESGDSLTISEDGIYNITSYTYDKSNNKSDAQTVTVKIHKTGPIAGTMNMRVNDASGDEYKNGEWTNQDVYIAVVDNSNDGWGTVDTSYEVVGTNTVPAGTKVPTTLTSEGTSTIKVTSKDEAGNISTREYTVKINREIAKQGNIELRVKNARGDVYWNDTWTKNDVFIGIVGNADISYEITGANTVPAGTKTSSLLMNEGVSTVKVTTIVEGGESQVDTYSIKIDRSITNASGATIKKDSATGDDVQNDKWVNSNVFVKIAEGNDDLSGILETTYEVKGANILPAGTTASTVLTKEGTSNIIVTTKDNAGNIATKEYIVKIDKSITKTANIYMKKNNSDGASIGNNNWTNSDVYLEMTDGKDDYSGISDMYYEVTGANTVPSGTTAPTTLTNEGTSTITITTKDNIGNIRKESCIVSIDRKGPTKPTLEVTGDKIIQDGQWYTDNVKIKVNGGVDNGNSGIRNIVYEIVGSKDTPETVIKNGDSIIISEDGSYTVAVYEYDNAGNKSDAETVAIKLDKTEPTSGTVNMKLKDANGDTYVNGEITNQKVYVELVNGKDSLDKVETTYEVTGANVIAAGATAPTTLIKNGESTIIVTTKDEAGHVVTSSYTVKMDKDIAKQGNIEMKLKDVNGDVYWNDTWTNKDVYVGIVGEAKEISYEVTGANTIAAGTKTSSTLTNEGISTITVTTINEDDSSKIDTYLVKIDKSNPEKSSFNVTGNKATNGSEWYVSDVQVQINGGTDKGSSGVSKVTYEITGDKNIKETVIESGDSLTISEDGTYNIIAYTYDNANNKSDSETVTVKIHKTGPIAGTMNMRVNDASGDEYKNGEWTNQDVYIAVVDNSNDGWGTVDTSYEVVGANTVPTGTKVPTTLTSEGTSTIKVTSKDEAGIISTREYTVKINREIAKQGNIELRVKNARGDVYWNNTWTRNDVFIGIVGNADISYEITGANTVPAGTKTSSLLMNEGISTVKVTTIDGGINKIDTYTIKIDKNITQASGISMKKSTGDDVQNDKWVNSDVFVKIAEGNDKLSGILETTYEVTRANVIKAGTKDNTVLTKEGTSNITVTTKDNAGNIATKGYTVKIDKSITKTANINMKKNDSKGENIKHNTWTNSDVYLEMIDGKDDYSGIADMYYEVTGANTVPSGTKTPTTLTQEGTSIITVTTKDNIGNIRKESCTVSIDRKGTTKSTLVVTGDKTVQEGEWYTSNVQVKVTSGEDTGNSNVQKVTYKITGMVDVPETSINSGDSIELTQDGIYTIVSYTYNNAGSRSEATTVVVKIDKTAPETGTMNMKKDFEDGEDYTNDTWTNKDIYISLVDGTDILSGHLESSFEVTGAENIASGTEKVTLTKEGTYKIKVTSKDIAGNVSIREYIVKIDKTVPEVPTLKVISGQKNAQDNSWYISDVILEAQKGELDLGGSGIARITYTIQGAQTKEETEIENLGQISITKDGIYIITVYNYDVAGNKSEGISIEVKRDSTNPTGATLDTTAGTMGLNDWYTTNVEFKVLAKEDATSRIAKITYEITGNVTGAGDIAGNPIDVGDITTNVVEIANDKKVIITAQGTFSITAIVYDNAGNKTTTFRTIKIDKSNPTAPTINLEGTMGEKEIFIGDTVDARIVWGEDVTSGMHKVTYTLTGAQTSEETEIQSDQTLQITEDGTTTITVKSYDNSGNVGEVTKTIKKDKLAPELAEVISISTNSTGFDLKANGLDSNTGIAVYEVYVDGQLYSTNKSTENTIIAKVTDQTSGIHEVYVIVKDAAGNSKQSTTINVKTARLKLEDIERVEFVISEYKKIDNDGQVVNIGSELIISDTSSTFNGKYMQITGTGANVTGSIKGSLQIVRKDGSIVTQFDYYPTELTLNMSYYTNGSGTTWTHNSSSEFLGNNLKDGTTPEGIAVNTNIAIGDKLTSDNHFSITETKQTGIQTYTRVTIQSIMIGTTRVNFSVINNC